MTTTMMMTTTTMIVKSVTVYYYMFSLHLIYHISVLTPTAEVLILFLFIVEETKVQKG